MSTKTGVLALILSGVVAQPQSPAATDRPDFGVTTNIVMVPVTVTQRDGSILNGLSANDFRLLDNNKVQKITQDMTTHPLSIAMVIQATTNMESMLPKIQKLSSLLQAQVLGDEGEVAVLAFDHRIEKLADFTSDEARLQATLKKLKPGSGSARLNDAAIEGIRLLKTRPATRRRILLLISEPHDKGSELRVREVLSEAEFAGVVIYSVNVSSIIANATTSAPATRSITDNNPPGSTFQPGPGGGIATSTTLSQNNMGNWAPLMKEIYTSAVDVFKKNPSEIYTSYTGGRGYAFGTQKELERAVSAIGEELHSQYLLTYSPNNQDEAGFHNIVVQVLKPDLKIRSRDGYYIAGKLREGK